MKRTLSLALGALLLLAVCLASASCSSAATDNWMVFGEKYRSDNDSYVFYSDHSGVYEIKYTRYTDNTKTDTYTVSGHVDFVWREAADGSVYLFPVETHYDEEHTGDTTIGVTNNPIVFGDGFFAYTRHSQFGASNYRYILENSKLEEALKDE